MLGEQRRIKQGRRAQDKRICENDGSLSVRKLGVWCRYLWTELQGHVGESGLVYQRAQVHGARSGRIWRQEHSASCQRHKHCQEHGPLVHWGKEELKEEKGHSLTYLNFYTR